MTTGSLRGKVPVAQAFDAADRMSIDFLQRALELIQMVHTCVHLPRVIFQHAPYRVEGEYRPTIPPQIVIAEDGRNKLSLIIHHIGHLLDQFGFATGQYGVFETRKLRDAKYAGPLRPWWTAVQDSATVKTLAYALDDPLRLKSTVRRIDIIPDKEDLAYMLAAEELWARSYVQYITIKTRDTEMMSDLQSVLIKPAFSLLEHWPQPEFTAIEAQIDAMFARLGWRKA